MTMSSSVSKVTLNGDGVQTSWPFSFKVWKAGDLEVSITSPDGTNTVVTDWTVDLGASGGTVTYPITGYPLPLSWKITIRRSMDFLQEVDLVSGTRWDPEVVETALDQAAAERQQLLEEIGRSVKIGVASTEDPTQVVNQVFLARDQAAASAGAAATSESNAADSAAAAQTAADYIGVLQDRGVLSTGQNVITLMWPYSPILRNVAVYLDGVKQDADTALIYTDAYTITLTEPVTVATNWEVISVTLAGDSILSGYVDQAQTIVNNAALSNLPIGAIVTLTGSTPAAGTVAAEGQLLSRAVYPDLWTYAQASGNIAASDGVWTKGQYSPGDGSTTFRVPNLQDQFIRGASGTRAVGNGEEDAFQGHGHNLSINTARVVTPDINNGTGSGTSPAAWGAVNTTAAGPITDGTNGTPRTANETRPKNVAYLICIKAYDVISDPNVLNAVGVVNEISRLESEKLRKDENINLGVSVAASGTAVDFVGIPEGVKRITVMFDGVSTNGTSHVVAQLGSGAIETSGYVCGAGAVVGAAVGASTYTTGFGTYAGNASDFRHGCMNISKISGNMWVVDGAINANGANNAISIVGSKSLSGALDRIRITTVNGTDIFDAGTINISWEF